MSRSSNDRKIRNNPSKRLTAQGSGRNSKYKNKHKKRCAKKKYRGQGK